MRRLSNKYGENNGNNKFFKILLLQREKVKKGFVKAANFAKIAKVTGIFLAKGMCNNYLEGGILKLAK